MRSLAFLCLVIASHAAQAADWGFEPFAASIREHQANTVEDALALVPNALWNHYALVQKSLSTQGATPASPRAILFGEDARVVLTFNGGDPKQHGFNTIEMFEVEPQTDQFAFHRITFTASQAPTFSEKNPRLCLTCHKANPRPNWAEYSTWPGLYGESDDELGTAAPAFADFVAHAWPGPRYHRLVRNGGDTAPFGNGVGTSITFRPNLQLTKYLTRWNAKRVARAILDSDRGRVAGFAILAAELGCEAKDVLAAARKALGATAGTSDLDALYLHAGLTPGDLDIQLKPGDSFHPYFNDGQHTVSELLVGELYRRLMEGDAELTGNYKPARDYRPNDDSDDEGQRIDRTIANLGAALGSDMDACTLVLDRAKKALDGTKPFPGRRRDTSLW